MILKGWEWFGQHFFSCVIISSSFFFNFLFLFRLFLLTHFNHVIRHFNGHIERITLLGIQMLRKN